MNITSRKTIWLLGFGWFTATGLLLFTYRYLDDLAGGEVGTLPNRLIEQMTGAYSSAILFPPLVMFARRHRLDRANWVKRLPLHWAFLCVFSAVHTTLMFATRSVLFPLAGLGAYDYGVIAIRYPMELANDVITYWVFVGVIYAFDHYRESRDRELQTVQLEGKLSQAKLQALRLQIHPHFLFNALNTISAVLYEDVRLADRMIARLSDLLRRTLSTAQSQEVTLGEELDFLDHYLDIMRVRFEERLDVKVKAAPEMRRALVPQLVLQPLVENSIKHAANPVTGAVTATVGVRLRDDTVLIEICDDGPGVEGESGAVFRDGIGLSNTAERLRQLYGERGKLSLANIPDGGLAVRIELPFRTRETQEKEGSDAGGRR